MDPSFLAPHRQWLARVDAKIVEAAVTALVREPGAGKPAARELGFAVRQVFTAEHAKTKHVSRRQLRAEFGIEITPDRRGENVTIAALHFVVDDNCSFAHRTTSGLPQPTTKLVSTKLVSQGARGDKASKWRAANGLSLPAQKTGPLRARFGDRRRGGAGDHLPREELLAGMHHLLPTGIAVRHHYAKLNTEAQRNRRHASHALKAKI
jgi:hypothetical protein